MENPEKFVEFDRYCAKCRYKDKRQDADPCNECLLYPTNTNSRKPVRFEQEEEKQKGDK